MMIFEDRTDAGRQLAPPLAEYANCKDAIVLGIPRGGVIVAFEIAQALHLPLDLFLSRKLGVPGHEELAFGAIAAGDGRYLDEKVIRAEGISPQDVERVTAQVKQLLNQRAALYRGDRPPLQVEGQTVILVDDGIATGASMYAAINALRQMKPAALIVAAPVAPPSTCAWLRTVVDRLVCLHAPQNFYAVGQFFQNFSQVEDEEIIALLRRGD
jgi:putative phosphoribosyl transferase